MGTRGSNELRRSCSTVEQPIRADWPEVLFFARASQPLCQLPLIHLAPTGPSVTDAVSLTARLPPTKIRSSCSGRIA